MAGEIDFTVDPTPEQLGKIGKFYGISEDAAREAWLGNRELQVREQVAREGVGPVGRFKRTAGEVTAQKVTGLMREPPGAKLLEFTGGTPEGVGRVAGGVASAVTGVLPETSGEALADLLLVGRGMGTRVGKLGARFAAGLGNPLAAGALQAGTDVATGARPTGEALTQGGIRAVTQGAGDVIASASSKGLAKADAAILGRGIESIFPNRGTAEDLFSIAGGLVKPRLTMGNRSLGLDDLEGIVKMSVLPQRNIPSGHIAIPPGTDVRAITVMRPAPGRPAGLEGAPGAGEVGFKVAPVEEVIKEIRHLRSSIRAGLETNEPLAKKTLTDQMEQRKALESSLLSQLSQSGQMAFATFDDLAKKAHAIQEMLKVGGFSKESVTPRIDLKAIQDELVNFKGSKTPLIQSLHEAGISDEMLQIVARGSTDRLGARDVLYGPLRVFSMLAGTGAAGGVPVGSLRSAVGRIPGAAPAVTAGTTVALGREAQQAFGSPLISFPNAAEVR